MRIKSNDLEILAKNLDITPTMYQYAVDRYKGISEYLKNNGVEAQFYPQGSFRTGTVVRPLRDGEETDYDIDVICEVLSSKNEITPSGLKLMVGNYLKESDLYCKKLLDEDEVCWTLEYAGVEKDVGFLLDIVPCVHEDEDVINTLINKGVEDIFANSSVAITIKYAGRYDWGASNPKGFGEWFDCINEPIKQTSILEKKKSIFNENRALFAEDASIEDVPDDMVRSSLQIVIQLLKRHRDLYYNKRRKSDIKPISAIVTSLAAKIVKGAKATKVEELLELVVDGLKSYSALLEGVDSGSNSLAGFIQRNGSKWEILNPVNPDDNYADSWTDETAKVFFEWVDALYVDLVDTNVTNESKYINGLVRAFDKSFTEKSLGINASDGVKKIDTAIKPWRE